MEYSTIIMLVVLIVVSSLISDKFFTLGNILNLLRQNVGLVVMSMGMLFVILTGGIDLSVGAMSAFGSVIVATCLVSFGFGTVISIVVAVLSGMVLGLFTGLLVAYVKMAPFIATLSMMTISRGFAYMISNGSPIQTPIGTMNVIGTARVGVFPALILFAAVVVAIFFIVHKYTAFGRIVIAVGSNSQAVQLAGIQIKRYLVVVYAISGLCAAMAGVVSATRTYIGSPSIGTSMELDAIASVVIGGASLSGGRGFVLRTVVGVIILGLISNIMNLVGVPPYPQEVIKGLIIIAAVCVQGFTKRTV